MKDEERSDDVSNGKRAGPWFFVGDFTNYPALPRLCGGLFHKP